MMQIGGRVIGKTTGPVVRATGLLLHQGGSIRYVTDANCLWKAQGI